MNKKIEKLLEVVDNYCFIDYKSYEEDNRLSAVVYEFIVDYFNSNAKLLSVEGSDVLVLPFGEEYRKKYYDDKTLVREPFGLLRALNANVDDICFYGKCYVVDDDSINESSEFFKKLEDAVGNDFLFDFISYGLIHLNYWSLEELKPILDIICKRNIEEKRIVGDDVKLIEINLKRKKEED